MLGGSSGSPLIADGEIVSVINTTNGGVSPELGDTCYLGKPCEVSGTTATFEPDTRFVFSSDGVGSATAPRLAVSGLGDGGVMVDPLFEIPDIANLHVLYGPPASTDCADRDAYFPYRRQSFFIEAEELPRFCAVGFNMAGNESPVSEQVLEKP